MCFIRGWTDVRMMLVLGEFYDGDRLYVFCRERSRTLEGNPCFDTEGPGSFGS